MRYLYIIIMILSAIILLYCVYKTHKDGKILAKKVRNLLFAATFSILANIGHLGLDDKELRMAFSREFRALTSLYGKPPKSPEFAMKAEFTL